MHSENLQHSYIDRRKNRIEEQKRRVTDADRKKMLELANLLTPDIFKMPNEHLNNLCIDVSNLAQEEEEWKEIEVTYKPKKVKILRILKPHILDDDIRREYGWLVSVPGNNVVYLEDDEFDEWFEQRSL